MFEPIFLWAQTQLSNNLGYFELEGERKKEKRNIIKDLSIPEGPEESQD